MAAKRRPLHSDSRLNFRSASSNETTAASTSSCDVRGKKPLPEPTTVSHVLLMMVLHACRKTIFFDTTIKVGIYGASLFVISLIADTLPIPKTYFARSDNFFNQYFVKLGWGWTLLLTFPFLVLTSYTYCCGKREKVFIHSLRLCISTCNWFFWVKAFSYIEANYGRCLVIKSTYLNKWDCVRSGHFWSGFDISGHAFILIYSSLVLIEEARAISGWEGIRDFIRNEEHYRNMADKSASSNPLRSLTTEEFSTLKTSYEKYTPYIRSLFIAMTCLTVLWDVMLVSTILYYHIMIEKFISGAIAILMWYVTYRFWYTSPRTLLNMPGEGLFRYRDVRQSKEIPLKRRSASTSGNLPTFMGMPLHGLRNVENRDIRFDKDEGVCNENENQSTATYIA